MIVCIAEKPSVARDIARVLGANEKKEGFFEGNGYRVTWTYGHLCTLKEPSDYRDEWKFWSIGSLPMIPDRFGIKLIDQPLYKKQFEVIRSIVSEAEEVVNCGDAGQEGELIQRWVLQKAGMKCPMKRLWISSLTDDAIRDGFHNLKDAREYENLYHAGLSRAIGDWLLGLNATRLFSLRYTSRGTTLSVGRVQTPTLAMIVQRQREIDNFKAADYWEVRIAYRNVYFNATPQKKYNVQADAAQLCSAIEGKTFTVTSVENKTGKESAPRLFDLTSLQVECNNKWGWSADDTLKLIQSLYEKKLTTYPRVDTTYLSEDIYAKVPDILKRMTPYKPAVDKIMSGKISKSKRIFDNSKVTDHHAIIPTGESPSKLTDSRERQLYHLIATRFLANFYPDCKFSTMTVKGKVEKSEFKTTGKTIIEKGWREILQPEAKNGTDRAENADSDNEGTLLPPFEVGESGPCTPQLLKRTTQPPKAYTEATLLKAMETAGKSVEAEELREALKENGIGRPSTRSAIIETLIKRGYVQRNKKKLTATQAGMHLIDTISYDLLKSAELTGLWENRLRRIEAGTYSASEFIALLKQQLHDIIRVVLNDTKQDKILVEKNSDDSKTAATRRKRKGKEDTA